MPLVRPCLRCEYHRIVPNKRSAPPVHHRRSPVIPRRRRRRSAEVATPRFVVTVHEPLTTQDAARIADAIARYLDDHLDEIKSEAK